ncbi:hypothetical protein HOP38_02655 [Vibrio mediterranei]|uniref:portal protein n=1 Tax=Vibrio mediterranei TaxID=689 RepID=UPI0018560D11|nr:hypothetical protein [Vibrio mediterranei]NUW71411.1 hypothetical protein [Vibrio mediterranei]
MDMLDGNINDHDSDDPQTDEKVTHKLEGALGEYIGNATDLNHVLGTKKGDNYAYYYGEKFGNEQDGQSDHITMDVFDAVESAKARLLSTFTGARNIIHYKPQTTQDVENAALRNALVKDIFWNDNKGYKILHDAFHDGLLNRWFGLKWYWEKNPIQVPGQATIPHSDEYIYALDQQLTQSNAQLIGVTQNPDSTVTVDYAVIKDAGKVKIEVIAPERILIESGAEDQETSSFIAEEMRVTGSELVKMGVSQEALKSIDNYRANADTTTESRRRNDETTVFENDSPTQEGKIYKVYNAFIEIDLIGDGIAQLYNCICDYNGQLLIDPVPVDRPQLIVGSLLPQAHKINGMALAEVIKPIQKSGSMVMRQYIDHLSRVNTGRMAADMQLVRNPKQLLENHIGGIVDVEFIDGKPAMMDIPQPQLSPATGIVLEELKQEKEQRGGVSRLAQGLNSDAVSNQNADSLIERLTNLSTARIMMMARHIAEMILKPLFDGIYKLSTQMDEKPRLLEIGGEKTEISPTQMQGDFELSTEMTVTEEEAVKRAQGLMLMHNTMLADPDAGLIYPTAKRYAIYSEVFKSMGESPHMFMQDPSGDQGMQSFSQMQMQLQQMQQQIGQMGQYINQMEMQNQNLQLALSDKQFNHQIEAHKEKREDAKFAHDVIQDRREYELEKSQKRGVTL